MGRRRQHNRHLPECVQFKHGAYYLTKNKKWLFLGKTIAQMYAQLAKISNDDTKQIVRMGELFDRYMAEIAPLKAETTFKSNCQEMVYLRAFFEDMAPSEVTPVHVYAYLDSRSKKAPIKANREKALLSHAFSMAIKWGVIAHNPCRDVKRNSESIRDRYVTDEEFLAVRSMASHRMQNIMDFAYLTGLRRGDILDVKLSDINQDGIFVLINKTRKYNKKLVFEWSDVFKSLVDRIISQRGKVTSLYLFNTHKGKPFTPDGFSTIWQRLITKAFKAGVIKEKFRFHDLRRKAATDAERTGGREYARQLLGHATQIMTDRYISGPRKIIPLKMMSK